MLRNYEGAIPLLEKAFSLGVRSEEVFYTLGFCYAYTRQCDMAVPWFEQALEMNEASTIARQGLDYCSQE